MATVFEPSWPVIGVATAIPAAMRKQTVFIIHQRYQRCNPLERFVRTMRGHGVRAVSTHDWRKLSPQIASPNPSIRLGE